MDNKLVLSVNFLGSDKLSGMLKNVVGLGKTGSQVLRRMKGDASALDRELAEVRRELAGASGNVTELANRERQLARAAAIANTDLAVQIQRVRTLARIQGEGRAIAARAGAAQSFGTSQVTGAATLGFGVGLIAKGAMEFDGRMTDIGIKLGIGAKDTDALAQNIFAAAKASSQLPTNIQRGADALASAGLKSRELSGLLTPIGKVAVASGADVEDLAKTAAANFQNLKVPIGDAALALGVMSAAGKAGKFELKDMAQNFPALTARAQNFGQTGVAAVADLAAAAQIAARAVGNDMGAASINLENVLAKINMMETRKKFSAMGVDLQSEMAKAMAAGMTPLEAIATITEKTLKGNMGNLTLLWGDQQAQQGISALINNMGEYRKVREQSMKDGPKVMLDYARKTGDAAIKWQALVGAGQQVGREFGTAIMPALLDVGEALLGLVSSASAWMKANPEMTSAIAKGLVFLIGMKFAVGALSFAFGSILGPVGKAWMLFQRFRSFGGITGTIMRVAAKFQQWAPLFLRVGGIIARFGSLLGGVFSWIARGAMLLVGTIGLPWALLIAGVAAAAYFIYSNWGAISAFLSGIWAKISGGAAALWPKVKAAFLGGLTWLIGLHASFLNAGLNLMKGLGSGITGGLGWVKDKIVGAAANVKNWFTSALGIKSPSRVFMAYGGYLTKGLALGIDRSASDPRSAIKRLTTGLGGAAALGIAGPALAGAGLPAQGAVSRSVGAQSGTTIIVNVYGAAGQDVNALADAVIARVERLSGARARINFADEA